MIDSSCVLTVELRRWLGWDSTLQLHTLITTAQTLAPDDVTSSRWQHLYPGYLAPFLYSEDASSILIYSLWYTLSSPATYICHYKVNCGWLLHKLTQIPLSISKTFRFLLNVLKMDNYSNPVNWKTSKHLYLKQRSYFLTKVLVASFIVLILFTQ